VTSRLPVRIQILAEAFTLLAALSLVGYTAWFMAALVMESVHYGDLSTGIIPVALWVPQSVAAFGITLLLVAIIHTFFDLLRTGKPVLSTPDEV
jgi:TRAP-type C4-dicarboxylate transport system permease small subunit